MGEPLTDDPSRAHERGRTREGLTQHELAMLGKMQDAIAAEALREKPRLPEMCAWVDTMETRERNALHAASCVNGYVPETYVRSCAIGRELYHFMVWCVDHREDLQVLFRAKQHMKRRRS